MDTLSPNDRIEIECARMQRVFGIIFGLSVHALFAITVWHLFWFLKDPEMPAGDRAAFCSIVIWHFYLRCRKLVVIASGARDLLACCPRSFTAACFVPSAV